MTPLRAMVSRSSTRTKATPTLHCLNSRSYCLSIRTTRQDTSWQRRRSPKRTATMKLGTCLLMVSRLPSVRAMLTHSPRWKGCWQSWERSSLRGLRHPKHRAFYDPRKQLVQLHDRNHRPRHDHFPFLFTISVQSRSSYALRCNSANSRWPDFFQLLSPNRIRAEVGLHIAWAN